MIAPYASLASLYDTLLGDRFFPQLRRTFEWLVRRYNIRFVAAADVACGTGTFVRYLRDGGVPIVYGVDRSPNMLCVAIRKNRGNGAAFLLQDFAALQLPQPVDLITCNFDSLNYLKTPDALRRALRRFYVNLKPGGHLIFDVITRPSTRQRSTPRLERVEGPGFTFVRCTSWNSPQGLQVSQISVSRHGHTHREVHTQRPYSIAAMIALLNQARFALLGAHDFYACAPATSLSARVVYVARKPFR